MKWIHTRRQVKHLIDENKELKEQLEARREGLEIHQEILNTLKLILQVNAGESVTDRAKWIMHERAIMFEKLMKK